MQVHSVVKRMSVGSLCTDVETCVLVFRNESQLHGNAKGKGFG